MKEATRAEIWSLLSDAFESIQKMIGRNIPELKTQMGHHRNDTFWFRAYATYSNGERETVISFDVQPKGALTYVRGDIAEEGGLVIKDVIDSEVGGAADINTALLETAKRFALACKDAAGFIEESLK